jgi:hypothetical protein
MLLCPHFLPGVWFWVAWRRMIFGSLYSQNPAQQQHSTLIKKENQILFIYKEIQNGAVAKSYMTNGLLIYGEIFAHFLIY